MRATVLENLTHHEADMLYWKDEGLSKSFLVWGDTMTCLISCSIERECRSMALMFIVTFLSPADTKAFITVCKCTAACKVIFCGSYSLLSLFGLWNGCTVLIHKLTSTFHPSKNGYRLTVNICKMAFSRQKCCISVKFHQCNKYFL
jgi:hypothetical protein